MITTVTVFDKAIQGKVTKEIKLSFQADEVTVRDIIVARVIKEVEDYNTKLPEYFLGLIQPSNAEATLNGFKMKEKKMVDAEKQVYVALDAFQKNGYFVLVNSQQMESLDQKVKLAPSTAINFVKLTPLVGG